jgi:hypothetical protein
VQPIAKNLNLVGRRGGLEGQQQGGLPRLLGIMQIVTEFGGRVCEVNKEF